MAKMVKVDIEMEKVHIAFVKKIAKRAMVSFDQVIAVLLAVYLTKRER